MKYSGIGGQAVMEGVMMQNKDTYAVAVRKPDHEIDVKVSNLMIMFTEVQTTKALLFITLSIITNTDKLIEEN